jgi:ATP-binding cassette, subfamily F, member 3
MLLLSCTGLRREFDRGPLFEDLGFELYNGERVGLVGPNGVGKTTLMRILAGLDTSDAGDFRLHAGARALLLEQHAEFPAGRTLFAEAKSAFDELLKAQEELVRVAELLAKSTDAGEHKSLAARYDRLHELLGHNDAYALDHKVEQVLGGLGFQAADYDRDLNTFSGGQQRRVLLAKLLLAGPDVMLLDEPSNHLDIDATRWLEDYLAQQPQAMIIVSHDRYFLNRVTTKIFELHSRRITSYPGNFQQYVRLRQERYEHQLREYEAQKEYIEKEEELIRRTHYGQMARMAQSRVKKLEKIDRIEMPTLIDSPHMHFGQVVRAGDVVVSAENLGKSYGDLVLFKGLSFDVQRGKRLGIMGPNGSGKTTLLRILLGDEEPTEGEVKRGHLVEFGYLDQHLKLLDEEKPIIRAIWPQPDPELTEQKMRDLLGRFGLSGPIVEQPVKECSGGERSRAALARLVVQGANVLVLDEPTNHLDIWACDALEEAVREFEGTVIVVSHDRYLLNRVCDLLVVLENGRCEVVYGNYDTYELLRASRSKSQASRQRKRPEAENKRPEAKRRRPEEPEKPNPARATTKPSKRKRKFPYRKIEDLEKDIAAGEEKAAELETSLASAETYRDASRFHDTLKAFEETKTKLARLYEHWEEASELN